MADTQLKAVITADTSQANSQMQGFAATLKANREGLLAIGAAAGIAFAGIAGFAKSSVEAASKQQDSQAQLAAVIKSTGNAAGVTVDGMNRLSDALSHSTGYTNDAITSVQTMLIGMKSIGSDAIPGATQAILDFAARTGQDAVSASAMLGKALGEPRVAIGALTREHIILTQAQQDAIQHFVAVGDTANAQKVILEGISGVVGGAAEQTNTLAFQQRELNAQMTKAQETIGAALIPVITSLLKAIEPIITKLAAWIEKHPELTKWIFILGGLLTGLVTILTALALILPALIAGFAVLTGPIGLVILAITALVAITVLVIAKWSTISAFFKQVWTDIQKIFKEAIDAVVAYFQPLIDIVNAVVHAMEAAASAASKVASAVGHGISSAVSTVTGKRAGGGPVTGGSAYLVGERGPELFVPGASGGIVPNGGVGGQTIVVNVNGGYYLDQRAAGDFADILTKIIGQNLKLRTI